MVAVQVRDVPEPVRLALVAEAGRRGESLQSFLLDVLEREAANARNREIVRNYVPHRVSAVASAAELISAAREERDSSVLTALVGAEEAERAVDASRSINARR